MKLKISSAIAIEGKIVTAGTEVDVADVVGKNLIARGKAEEVTAPVQDEDPNTAKVVKTTKTPKAEGAGA